MQQSGQEWIDRPGDFNLNPSRIPLLQGAPLSNPLPRCEDDGSDLSLPQNLPSSLAVQGVRQSKQPSSERQGLGYRLPEPLSLRRLHSNKELDRFYVSNKTAISRAKKQKLVELYAYLIGGKVEECEKLRRDHLLELIYDLVSWAT